MPQELPHDLRFRVFENKEIFYKYLKNAWGQRLALNLSSRNKTFVIAAKDYAEVDIKDFCSYLILLDFVTLLHVFCPQLSQ